MHSVLFVATKTGRDNYGEFLGRVERKLAPDGNEARYAGCFVQLAENVWLLNVAKSAEPLGWLTSQAQVVGVPYGLLTFDSEPQWLPSDFRPSNWE